MGVGKVEPFSQISTSFLIFSYTGENGELRSMRYEAENCKVPRNA